MKFTRISILIMLFGVSRIHPQVENVPIYHPVYTFLKEMKVKNILPYISEDVPNLSRFQVKEYLDSVKNNSPRLSDTEKDLTTRYLTEFSDIVNDETTTILFNPDEKFTKTASEFFSDKIKYTFVHQEENANLYFEMLQDFYYGGTFKPSKENVFMYDFGFRFRGTVFKQLGYYLTFQKGGVWGSRYAAETIKPGLLYNFKWLEDADKVNNYDLTNGYLKFHTEPAKDMNLSFQLGREPKTVGYGYGSKLVLSGYHPALDFLQFNFDYGIFHLSSIHATTVGQFSTNREDRYTKFWAFNRVRITIPDLFDIGAGESVVYSDRGFDIAYLTPVGWYKFVEMAIQDRDNANMFFDFQTSFIPNLELQGTLLLDENIFTILDQMDSYKNKTAYQLGAYWYEAFTIQNLSLIMEYTKIRPYVYTHFDIKNTYTAFDAILGHPIGPNADELFTRLGYQFNDWIRMNFDYRHIREGENVYDSEGNLVKNVGGDVYLTHGQNPKDKTSIFLDGIRINHDILQVMFRIEPIRDYIFEIIYNYNITNNLTAVTKNYQSFAYVRLIWEY